MASLIILIFQYLVFLFVRKILEFILPLPFFPAVSSILAKAVGLDPLAFQPIYTRLALPKLSLPHIPNISIIPASQRHFPFEPRIPLIKDFKVPGIPMLHSTKDDATIPLGEKVHTWRQNQLLANAQPERGIMSMTDFANKNLKPTIDKIDFGVSEIEKDVAAVNLFTYANPGCTSSCYAGTYCCCRTWSRTYLTRSRLRSSILRKTNLRKRRKTSRKHDLPRSPPSYISKETTTRRNGRTSQTTI